LILKEARNIRKHGISLARAEEIDMAAAVVHEDDRFDYGETRYIAFGEIDGTLHCLVFTFRGSKVQLTQGKPTRTDAMAKRPKFDPELHEENPEWTARDFARARPATEVLPPEVIAQFRNKGGRPRAENPKQAVKLRIDADVLARFRESGPGWQTRINRILTAAAPIRPSKPASGKKRALSKAAGKSSPLPKRRAHAN
jgi:uncharacterized protein (DUF4415 family)